MANICEFSMMIKGKHDNIKKFYDALTQANEDVWMGRGAEVYEVDDDGDTVIIGGDTKWSLTASLIMDAVSMREQAKEGIDHHWVDHINKINEFVTLPEACKKFNVNMEVFSSETGMCFQEHYKYEDGVFTKEVTDYYESYDENDNLIQEGGFEWDFDLQGKEK